MRALTAPHIIIAILIKDFIPRITVGHPESKQVLHVLIVALKLDLIVVKLMRYKMKPTSRLLEHHIDCHFRTKVRNEVQKGRDYQRILEKVI